MHGTCIGVARRISKNGFEISDTGRKGPGAYFWSYESDAKVARDLSIDWWNKKKNEGCFKHYSNPLNGCAVLNCESYIEERVFLDLLDPDMKEVMQSTILRLMDKNSQGGEENIESYLSRMASLFISSLEFDLNVRFKALKSSVDNVISLNSKKNIYHKLQMMNGRGYPILVVKDVSVIREIHIEEVPKDECA